MCDVNLLKKNPMKNNLILVPQILVASEWAAFKNKISLQNYHF